MTEGYCVKCRERVDMTGEEQVEMKNGKKAIRGSCSRCGTPIYRIKQDRKADYW